MTPILLSIFSAVLLIASFPKWNGGFLAWFALIPLLYAVHRKSLKQSLLLGFLTGFVSSIGIYYWVITAIKADGQSMFLGCLSLCALSLYMALYIGIFSVCVRWAYARQNMVIYSLFVSSSWICLEMVRTYFLTGFPWLLIGYTQWNFLSCIQIAELGGVYLISFLIIMSNVLLFQLITSSGKKRKKALLWTGVFLLIMISIQIYGHIKINYWEMRAVSAHNGNLRFSLLQGSIDQYRKWDESYENYIKKTYESVIAEAVQENPELIIWPETSLPGFFEEAKIRSWLDRIVVQSKAFHIFGSASIRNNKYYNSIFLLDPHARVVGRYDKRKLVLFGEKIPFSNILGKFINVLNELGGFEPGTEESLLQYNDYFLSASICFEAIFPNLVRNSVQQGAHVLINLTNDAWFLYSAAAYQHLIMNIFRAVENRRFVLRCANTGISAVIEPTGKIRAQTKLFETTVLNGTCSLITHITPYTRRGDIFAYLCCAFFLSFFCKLVIMNLEARN